MDVSGMDAAQKLSILASILFQSAHRLQKIPRQGIDGFTVVDGRAFEHWNVTVKPLVMARIHEGSLNLRVAPGTGSLQSSLLHRSEMKIMHCPCTSKAERNPSPR
jgi:homoserine dehydrogenase